MTKPEIHMEHVTHKESEDDIKEQEMNMGKHDIHMA